ncbi:mycolic acid cyclopropane synthetase family protein [Francisella philomiragia]|uniref:class I SAM-dependent methyltransferase n=1 Tax=Francisella philomiragia TaxID=28110 RepID=UPI0005A56DD4|nr:class I SAM-dependent methyltransferase [Francisella philomiragia]AJI57213.1 mycolic acid cyclopropane synthetase family protein [Francisella philomiragia]
MAKIFTNSGDGESPQIDKNSVKTFFTERAKKAKNGEITYKQAIIYQDKSGDLAEKRDRAEKQLLLPKLELTRHDRLLDIGCGTGRWTELVSDKINYYHGTDLIEELISIARERNQKNNVKFSCLPCTELSINKLNESKSFNKIIMFGVLIYLNDTDLKKTLEAIVELSSNKCILLLREPVGVEKRLTIKEHFSEDMDQTYNAVYRTERELLNVCNSTLGQAGFELQEAADVYLNSEYNNRAETKQKFFLFKRIKN